MQLKGDGLTEPGCGDIANQEFLPKSSAAHAIAANDGQTYTFEVHETPPAEKQRSWSLKPPKMNLLFFPQPCVHPWGFYGSSESLLLGIVGSRWSPAGPANLFDGGPCNAKGSSIIRFCSKPCTKRWPQDISCGGVFSLAVSHHVWGYARFLWQAQEVCHFSPEVRTSLCVARAEHQTPFHPHGKRGISFTLLKLWHARVATRGGFCGKRNIW